MDWKEVIERLTKAGWTQSEIAKRCGVSQSTISDLYRGATRSPSFAIGSTLQKLLEEGAATAPAAEERAA